MLQCTHLRSLEKDLIHAGMRETFRGKAWSAGCREWVYFDCVLDTKALRNRYQLEAFIKEHRNDDPRSGLEAGLVCTLCQDAVMGVHPLHGNGKIHYS
ncbi:hypothetical protein ABDD95_20895 [Mucilaginibacter sp. PAMB04274]|uniref:hypothetical protein n=1 Tax=Mucilaginibacter sp. PAMB04274 TaxID=3138568 RepID=UPI0031F7222D